MNFIKGLIYKYLYKSTGEQVMGALTDSYAYEIYKQTNQSKISNKEERIRLIKARMKDLESDIGSDIREEMRNGKYKSRTKSNKIRLNAEQKKYLKDHFKSEGFNIRFGIGLNDYKVKPVNTIIISWKHFKTF